LIEHLGSPQYHTRERAQEELKRLGTAAFDALLSAQDHDDIEVAMRARYLVRSMSVAWTREGDSPELKQLFRDYSSRDRDERETRAQHFGTLEDPSGTTALCRIVRFDVDRVLSKKASVMVLNRAWPATDADRQRRAELIRAEIASSRRAGAEWLTLYARTLDSPASAESDWERIIRGELEQLARHPQQSDRELTADLIRWHAELLLRLGRPEDAVASLRRTFDLIGDDRRQLYGMLDWGIEHRLHPIADELAARFEAQFQVDPQLLYRLAESQRKRDLGTMAESTADRARGLEPENWSQHWAIAGFLQFRVLMDWSEKELRHIAAGTKPEENYGAKSRWALAEMLFDMQREKEAAELTQSLVAAAATNQQIFESIDPDASQLQGYMNYYFGMHYARSGDRERQLEYFRKAIADWPDNPDFIIAMYRVPLPDNDWKKDTLQRLEAFCGAMRAEIRRIEGTVQQPGLEEERGQMRLFLANKLNELAWLISNTEGDLQEALAASKRSLELRPEYPAYLDTLGRCYFASGDLENAVQVQSRAVKLMPSMFVMQRQLAQFEQTLAQSRAVKPAPKSDNND
jgi:tetratricopeptide (TPR) repeat protein